MHDAYHTTVLTRSYKQSKSASTPQTEDFNFKNLVCQKNARTFLLYFFNNLFLLGCMYPLRDLQGGSTNYSEFESEPYQHSLLIFGIIHIEHGKDAEENNKRVSKSQYKK